MRKLPIQTCWPGDAGPLITWGLVVTRGPHKKRQNLGIYRQQVLARNKVIMRWLAHRGGALDFRDHALAQPGPPFPVAVALGADPATILGAVTPVPDTLSEYQFAGAAPGRSDRNGEVPRQRPAGAGAAPRSFSKAIFDPTRIAAAGAHRAVRRARPASAYELALEGPFGDHTGYYNERDWFPVLTIDRITMRRDPIYHSTYTGKPPDEPAVLGVALNEVFVPILQRTFPEIVDFYLPPEGCSYRIAVVSMRKQYAGHAKRVMFGVWSFLRQFMYTKFIIVVDQDVDARDWKDVVWALTTRVDPSRDMVLVENTPIDYLDFASPVSGLGSKMGLDATHKWPGETTREWGRPITMDDVGPGAGRRDLERTRSLGERDGDRAQAHPPRRHQVGWLRPQLAGAGNRVRQWPGHPAHRRRRGNRATLPGQLLARQRLQGHDPGGVHDQADSLTRTREATSRHRCGTPSNERRGLPAQGR